jgi:hypothetical protein
METRRNKMYESKCYSVKIIEGPREGTDSLPPYAGSITIDCHDNRLIAKEAEKELRVTIRNPLHPWDVEEFLELITGAFYEAGRKAGRKDTLVEIKKIKSSFHKLLAELGDGKNAE